MEELVKALSPWPLAQGVVIGLVVAAIGIWAMRRGILDSRREAGQEPRPVRVELTDEEKRREWEAFRHLEHIEKNSFDMVHLHEQTVELLRLVVEGINRFNDNRWNSRQ